MRLSLVISDFRAQRNWFCVFLSFFKDTSLRRDKANWGSYAQNDPILKIFAKIYAAEFNWLILANQIQAKGLGISIICSSTKKNNRFY